MPVTCRIIDFVAVVTIDNPPVNAISAAIRVELRDAVRRYASDPAMRAIVIAGAGPLFSGGADIREFGTPLPPGAPTLPDLIAECETCRIPIVVALHGTVVGGALELSLGCHARIAAANTRLGLPEVTIGFIPGAGGTQRLPRVAGLDTALRMILTGERIGAAEAARVGLVDEVVDGDVLSAAIAHARVISDAPPRRTRDRPAPPLDAAIVARHEAATVKEARGREAPGHALRSVLHGLQVPFDDGIAFERATFLELVNGPEARALRHVFFAERTARKADGIDDATPRRPVRRVGIVGAGTMGTGIAMSFANAGLPVQLTDADPAAAERGLASIRGVYAGAVSKGKLSDVEARERLDRITLARGVAEFGDADLVIEAAFEDMGVKQAVFAQLDGVCRPDAILATNTSSLDVNAIADATAHPSRVVGLHFFSPAHVMRLIEIVRPARVSADVLATAVDLATKLGKVAAVVGVCDGFVGNRMLFAYRQQANFLLEEGATPEQIDRALVAFGLPMGPYQMGDLAGLDISWRIRQRQAPTRPRHLRYSRIADMLCERGRFGQKAGRGWYRYEAGRRDPLPDPEVTALIESVSREMGLVRRAVSDTEIVERCLFPLVNEGARLLDEGIAARASDIDAIWINGYGFPRHRGGPMFWAHDVGLRSVAAAIDRLHDEQGDLVIPARGLIDAARRDTALDTSILHRPSGPLA